MPKSRTFTVTAPGSSLSLLPVSSANSNVPAPTGGRLPLRPARATAVSGPSKRKRRSSSDGCAFNSPVFPRTAFALFGNSAAELSSAPTVPQPAGSLAVPSSPFDLQPPSVRLPLAAAFLSPVENVVSRAAPPSCGFSFANPDASTVFLSPHPSAAPPGASPPANGEQSGPRSLWPCFPVSLGGRALGPVHLEEAASPAAVSAAVPSTAPLDCPRATAGNFPRLAAPVALPARASPERGPSPFSSAPFAQDQNLPGLSAAIPSSSSDAALFVGSDELRASSRLEIPLPLDSSLPELPRPRALSQRVSAEPSAQVFLQPQPCSQAPPRHSPARLPAEAPADPARAPARDANDLLAFPFLFDQERPPPPSPSQPSVALQRPPSGSSPLHEHHLHRPAPAAQRIVFTEAARDLLLQLHGGEIDLLQPLDENENANLISSLQSAAHVRLEAPLSHRMALSALEVSRHMPQACGWPSVEGALECLVRLRPSPAPNINQERPLQPPPIAPLPPTAPAETSALSSFVRRAAPLLPRPPSSLPTINSSLASSARFRNLLRSRTAPNPTVPTLASTEQASGEKFYPCGSCGESGHDAFNCPQGLDINHVVDAAQEIGRASHQRILLLSSSKPNAAAAAECSQAVRGEVVEVISELSGIDALDVSGRLDEEQGDAETTFISAMCSSRGGKDAAVYNDVCFRELQRRRRQPQLLEACQVAARAPDGPSAFRLLDSQINLPAHLGRSYRVDGGDCIELPPFPPRPSGAKRRRASEDDLPGFVVDDHDSEPDEEPSRHVQRRVQANQGDPDSHNRRRRLSSDDSSSSAGEDGSGSTDVDSGDTDKTDASDSSSSSGSSSDENGSSSSDEDGASSESSANKSKSAARSRGGHMRPSTPEQRRAPDTPLTAESLAQILKKLLDKRGRSDNNGLLASKTPSFWDLGKSPTGGYFAQTFTKVYGEFRQFKSVFGSKTGVSFKNLIMENMIPMIRDDLRLSRKDWKSITDRDLISKLKRRLGFRERDAYIAELEACPRLSASATRDMTVLNAKFKEMAAQMLSICERARNHGVKLLKPSCKHVFSEAVKNCYRVNQWFRLRPFKSIGDSVRHINSKLARRLASAAEQKHENAMDEAKLNGVRHQIGNGTTEDSSAPERKKGKVKGGINKNRNDGPNDKASRDAHSKKMDELYKAENELPKGRYWHLKTPTCDGDPCHCKFCQGCGDHQKKGRPWHDRPRCRQRGHPDFVATGYFHDKWPNRTSIHDKPSSSRANATQESHRDKTAARSNAVQQHEDNPQ